MIRSSLACVILIAITIFVFGDVRRCDFVHYDDGLYVFANPHIIHGLTREGIRWSFTADLFYDAENADYWQPVTFISRMLDFQIYGSKPSGHHITNLIFHLLNTILLFLLFKQMTGAFWQSVCLAAFFALHPLRVEAVAWVTARKDVLSTFFGFLTIWAYVWYVKHPAFWKKFVVILAFTLGLMSKPMLMIMPLILLLLDYWPLARLLPSWQKILLEKWPLFALSFASGLITLFFGQTSAFKHPSPMAQVINAPVSYMIYIFKMIFPVRLACYYPLPPDIYPLWQIGGSILIISGVTWGMVRASNLRPYLLMGWLWFLGSLLPVIGLANGAVADRFSYIPLIGLFIVIAWGISDLLSGWRCRRAGLAACALAVILAFAVSSHTQVRHWKNTITLFEHALQVTENNWLAHNNLGFALSKEGRTDEAISHFLEALKFKRDYAGAHYNLGVCLSRQGKLEEAIGHYYEAIQINPYYADAHQNLGFALLEQGRLDQALAHFHEVVRIKPDSEEARGNLAYAKSKLEKKRGPENISEKNY